MLWPFLRWEVKPNSKSMFTGVCRWQEEIQDGQKLGYVGEIAPVSGASRTTWPAAFAFGCPKPFPSAARSAIL